MIGAHAPLAAGLAEPSLDAQRIFRSVMRAMAEPGRTHTLVTNLSPPAPLGAASSAILLALTDFETPVWLDPRLSAAPAVATFLKFHTGATMVADPALAAFAVISDPAQMPPLSAFRQGTIDYPDRSATLLLQVARLGGSRFTIEGPGIDGTARFFADPLPVDFAAQWADNRAVFPCGVDLLLATGDTIAALPRSSRIVEEATCT